MRYRDWPSKLRSLINLLPALIALFGLGRAYADDPHPPVDGKAILNKVVRAVANNRAQLTDVRAEILVVTENRRVNKPTKQVFHGKGLTATSYAEPRTTSRETIAISGDQLRYDRTGGSAFEELNRDETWIVKPGEWRQYYPDINKGWLRIWSKLEERPRIDPRDYGCGDMRMEFQKWLEALEVRSAQLVRQTDGTTLARIEAKHGNGYELECSSGYGFLPSFVVTLYESKIISSEEISYQPVLKGKAWFPKTLIWRCFHDGAPQGPRSNDCQLMIKRFVTKLFVQPGDKPRPIAPLEVRPGSRIQDMRKFGD
jgi:hypothetical protein